MGSRDKGQRETKKAKKGSQKTPAINVMAPPPPVVEVIKKGKKAQE